MINKNLLFYPIPIISVNKQGLVTGKNFSVDTVFNVVHVGAIAQKYTDIDFSVEKISKGLFCNTPCTYCTLFDGDDTLLFISQDTFGGDNFTEILLREYKSRIDCIRTSIAEESYRSLRKYTKSVNDRMVRANYFNAYHQIFDKRLQRQDDEQTTLLSRICIGIKNATLNYFEDSSINFNIDYDCGNMIADADENSIINIILNSISFCMINSYDNVNIELTAIRDIAELRFNFKSKSAFDEWLSPDDNAMLNSSLSLVIAFEIAKALGYEYSISRKDFDKKLSDYTLTYKIPIKITSRLPLASKDTVTPLAEKLISLILFDEHI